MAVHFYLRKNEFLRGRIIIKGREREKEEERKRALYSREALIDVDFITPAKSGI